MSTRRTRPTRSLAALTACLTIGAAGALAGCSGGDGDGDGGDAVATTPAASASESEATASGTTPESTPTLEPTPEATTDGPPTADPANPDPLPSDTPPGTQLALGESMTVQSAVGVLTMDEGWSVLRYTVTGIEEGDASFLATLSGAEAYQGGRVFYVRGTVEVLALFGQGIGGMVGGEIGGVQSDGMSAGGVFAIGNDYAPTCTGDFIVSDAAVGAVQESCTVALAVPGTEVVGAFYYGDGTVPAGGTSDNPYYSNPVTWLP